MKILCERRPRQAIYIGIGSPSIVATVDTRSIKHRPNDIRRSVSDRGPEEVGERQQYALSKRIAYHGNIYRWYISTYSKLRDVFSLLSKDCHAGRSVSAS